MDFDFGRGEVECTGFHALFFELLGEGVEEADAVRKIVLLLSIIRNVDG